MCPQRQTSYARFALNILIPHRKTPLSRAGALEVEARAVQRSSGLTRIRFIDSVCDASGRRPMSGTTRCAVPLCAVGLALLTLLVLGLPSTAQTWPQR